MGKTLHQKWGLILKRQFSTLQVDAKRWEQAEMLGAGEQKARQYRESTASLERVRNTADRPRSSFAKR